MELKAVKAAMAWVIYALHLLLMVFVCIGPWIPDKVILLFYIMLIPFLQLHWITNNDTCALTVAECALRGVKPEKSFFHNLVSPVYTLNHKVESDLLWAITYVLWIIAVCKYYTWK